MFCELDFVLSGLPNMAEEESVNKRPRRAFSSTEKLMTLNMFNSFKTDSLHLIIQEIGFKFSKRCRNSMLTDRDDIFFWRRNYLRDIVKAREVGKNIYYLDET